MRGSDHRGEFRIGQRRDQAELQYTMGEVDLAARKERKAEKRKVNGIYTTKEFAEWPQYQSSSGGCWSIIDGKLIFGLHHVNCQFISFLSVPFQVNAL